ncbi:bifunctional proline dehydrogenase/L-glutamate gamma-semialdehyde dehydrogenase PutA [Sessilibacter sp. MAH4]
MTSFSTPLNNVLPKTIEDQKYLDESVAVDNLLSEVKLTKEQCEKICDQAVAIVDLARQKKPPLLDSFLKEYSLADSEGVALMCLAEALLRIPDSYTRDQLLSDKLDDRNWHAHIAKSESFWVNASSWGLLLTGQLVKGRKVDASKITKLVARLGLPMVRAAMNSALDLMAETFVLGETLPKAISRGKKQPAHQRLFSFDMLGEAARTEKDAQHYYQEYLNAINTLCGLASESETHKNSGVSIKLSALYSRYETSHAEQACADLTRKMLALCEVAAKGNIPIAIDAEEADRLEMSLLIFERLATAKSLKGWNGLGLVVQAYGKRAPAVIDWLIELAKQQGRHIPIRLVKGAYWDSEVKNAQQKGVADFPVYTRKSNTDVSYLACATKMLAARDYLYCQFATHNAHTIAAVIELAGTNHKNIELQRLHGMGDSVYGSAFKLSETIPPVRIYAPVGGHRDLLAYLVRRLVENGANSSFINHLLDHRITPEQLVVDPVEKVRRRDVHSHPNILKPQQIFGERKNSVSIDLTSISVRNEFKEAFENKKAERYTVTPLIAGIDDFSQQASHPLDNPANHQDELGQVYLASLTQVDNAFEQAKKHQPYWDLMGGDKRGVVLEKVADLLEENLMSLMVLLTREAGKTLEDALDEVREAVDFCRYYGAQARAEFSDAEQLPNGGKLAGEQNQISLHGRGVFVCISPWNFPLAIFVGQVAAALAAGNSVIAKPAPQTPLIAYEAIQLMYQAGVPKEILAFIPGGPDVGEYLVKHSDVGGVAFTGSSHTARKINLNLANRTGAIVPLIAETGGQNVMFVDSSALLEQVCDDVIRSAFASAGQRCSALRVLYVQEDIFDETLSLIKGAMDQLIIDNPANSKTDVGPIIDKTALEKIQNHIAEFKTKAVTHYTSGEYDKAVYNNGTFITPHLFVINSISELSDECFGPVLHVIKYSAKKLPETIQQAFSTGFGLTLGIQTRLESRWREIFAQAPVGNTYVNRNMVGAVVGLQPFGGQGLSGTGFKAGGPRYLYRFATEKTLTINTMAMGGNTELLNLSD